MKDTSKNLVGQPIFKQSLKFIPRNEFDLLVNKHKSDRYYETFDSWPQLTIMIFGALSRCDYMSEICDGMQSLSGKLNHLGFERSPAKSTAGDELLGRDNEFFQAVYFMLLEHFKPVLLVSRLDNVSVCKLFIFDISTISLFSDIMKGVGRNPKNEGKKKCGLKVHIMIDAHSDTPAFVKISEAKQQDKNFLQYLNLAAHSINVFDRAYNHYLQFARWSD